MDYSGSLEDYCPEGELVQFSGDAALNRLKKFYPFLEANRVVNMHSRAEREYFYSTSYKQSFNNEDNYRPPMYVYENAIEKFLISNQGEDPASLETGHPATSTDHIELSNFLGLSPRTYETLTRRAIHGSKPGPSDFKLKSWKDYAHAELGKRFKTDPNISKTQMDILAKSRACTSRKIVQNIIRTP